MNRLIPAAAAAGLALAPALGFAQAQTAAPPAPASAGSAQPGQPAATQPATGQQAAGQPTHPAAAQRPATAEARAGHRRERHMAHMRTAQSELDHALADLRAGRLAAARIALGHAETAVLNEHEAAAGAQNEDARAQALSTALNAVEGARTNLHRDRAQSERLVQDALAALRSAPPA